MANMHYCSDGSQVSQATINRRYSESLKDKHSGQLSFVCGGCGGRAVHNDHTISQARCKVIHKTELVWHQGNYESSCAKCHDQWEGFKSGQWIQHDNCYKRLLFLKTHDPDGYNLRIELTQLTLKT